MNDKLYLIPLTKGLKTCVDPADYRRFGKRLYHTHDGGNGGPYAAREGTAARRVFLHREILKAPPRVQVDHVNGVWLNGDPSTKILDNRRANLRPASGSQNQSNRGKQRNNTSGFKGVYWAKNTQRWGAQIQLHGRLYNLGFYDTCEDAARAYDVGCAYLHGLKFGRPNSKPDMNKIPPKVEHILSLLDAQLMERFVNSPDDFTHS